MIKKLLGQHILRAVGGGVAHLEMGVAHPEWESSLPAIGPWFDSGCAHSGKDLLCISVHKFDSIQVGTSGRSQTILIKIMQ